MRDSSRSSSAEQQQRRVFRVSGRVETLILGMLPYVINLKTTTDGDHGQPPPANSNPTEMSLDIVALHGPVFANDGRTVKAKREHGQKTCLMTHPLTCLHQVGDGRQINTNDVSLSASPSSSVPAAVAIGRSARLAAEVPPPANPAVLLASDRSWSSFYFGHRFLHHPTTLRLRRWLPRAPLLPQSSRFPQNSRLPPPPSSSSLSPLRPATIPPSAEPEAVEASVPAVCPASQPLREPPSDGPTSPPGASGSMTMPLPKLHVPSVRPCLQT